MAHRLAPWHVGSSWTRAGTRVPCIGRWILNHCTIREVPRMRLLHSFCEDGERMPGGRPHPHTEALWSGEDPFHTWEGRDPDSPHAALALVWAGGPPCVSRSSAPVPHPAWTLPAFTRGHVFGPSVLLRPLPRAVPHRLLQTTGHVHHPSL